MTSLCYNVFFITTSPDLHNVTQRNFAKLSQLTCMGETKKKTAKVVVVFNFFLSLSLSYYFVHFGKNSHIET